MSGSRSRALFAALLLSAIALPALAAGPVVVSADLWDKPDGSQGVKLSADHVKAGPVQFVVKNVSTGMDHELLLVKTDLAPEALPRDNRGVSIDENQLTGIEELGDLQPGQSKSTDLTLKPGKYLLFCNEAGHFKAGMYAAFTVE
jgi:uncharacterized cupredoxin-like copper-binding protein